MNNLQESILDAMKVFVKDSTSKLNFPLTLECEVIRCTDENKGEYEVKYLENNFLAYCQYKGFKYNPNDVVYVLIPRGDFSKTKVILGLERDELIESDLTDIEPNPAETPSADLDTIKIGDTVYNIAGTQPTEDIVKDVKVNGSSVVDNEKIANITVPTDTVTTTQMNNAINNATRDLVSETEMNSAIGEAISDLATETYVDNAVSPKANISDVNTALSYKADKSELVGLATETYVDNAVSPKANTSDVNAALALKANSADVTSALALKADKTELIDVEANPSDSGTEDLTKLKVGNTVYDIPSGGGGTEVVANPSGTATDDLNTIKIGNTIYDIPGGGGSGGSGEDYECNLLFENNPLPTPTSGTANVTRTYTLSNSIDDYDAVYVIIANYYVSSRGSTNLTSRIIFKPDFYLSGFDNYGYYDGLTDPNILRRINFTFTDSTHIQTLSFRSESDNEPILLKVYGLKFKSSIDIFNPQIYSEEERVVGTWTDGKPLYEKTVNFGSLPNNTTKTVSSGLSNISIQQIFGVAKSSNGFTVTLPHREISGSGNIDIVYQADNYIRIKTDYDYSGYTAYVTLQYTKTIDTAGSSHWLSGGVMAVNYTEDEQIIGQYLGKTLYQKTIDCGLLPDGNSINVNTPNDIDDLVFINGYAYSTTDATQQRPVPLSGGGTNDIRVDLYGGVIRITTFANWSSYHAVITIQYTKTTDTAGNPMANILATQKELEEIAYHYRDHCYTTLSDYYSTEERVVGRWTDGKPLYQKTYDLGSAVTINADSWYNTGISSGDMERIIEVSNGQAQTTNTWPLGSAIDSGTIRLLNERNNTITLRWFTIQYTKSTDTPGTGPTLGNLVYLPALYSEEEREVGVWTDGKPLYQKTVIFTSLTQNGWNNKAHNVANIDKVVYCVGGVSTDDGQTNYYGSGANNVYSLLAAASVTYANIYVGNYAFKKAIVTFQYTKTTDQPGSGRYLPDGQYSHHYSTSEHIVGTWIDGSTIYERTWTGLSIATNTAWHSTGIDVSFANRIISGTSIDNAGQVITESYAHPGYNDLLARSMFAGNTITTITLQYTKSV